VEEQEEGQLVEMMGGSDLSLLSQESNDLRIPVRHQLRSV
jgi:hypothetical protein